VPSEINMTLPNSAAGVQIAVGPTRGNCHRLPTLNYHRLLMANLLGREDANCSKAGPPSHNCG
jgi:hypothetical protein